MDIYTTIASWAGWPATVALLLVLGAGAYWVLNKRNDLLKERNELLVTQLGNQKENSPDVLAQQLAGRFHIATQELERLHADQKTSQDIIGRKEAELAGIRTEIGELRSQLEKAQESLTVFSDSGLLCPHCGAPLETREYHSEWAEYDGRDLEVDHEFIRYACGCEIVDGRVQRNCTRSGLG